MTLRWHVKEPAPSARGTINTVEFRVVVPTNGRPEVVETEMRRAFEHLFAGAEIEYLSEGAKITL